MKYNKLKRILALILATTTLVAMTACGKKDSDVSNNNSKDLKEITFVLEWTPNTNHTGLYVAQEKGYFAEEGLDVTIVQPPEDGATALVASGKAQFGISCQDTITPAIVGDTTLPITVCAALVQHNTSGIVSRKGEGMDTPRGLEGKKYATWDLDVEKAIMKNVIEVDGGDFSKVNLVPSTVTDEVTALQTKSVDAIWIFYAWGGIATKVKGLDTDYFAFKDINPVFDYYTPVVIANNEFLKKNADTAKAFFRALKKGYEYAIENPTDAAELLLAAVPELDADLVKESQVWLSKEYKAEEKSWGYINPNRWNAFYNWLNDNNLVETKIPENTGFTNEYLPE